MKLLKRHPLLSIANSYVIDSPQPSNINYMWNFGSLLALCLVIQIATGVFLAMHYTPHVDLAFLSVEHIMRDVNYGWMIRYLHANTASFFFTFVYLHMGRGLYYGSYKSPRALPWLIGVFIFLLMIITGFLGYVLPWGQMSLWAATVITNMMSAIPWIGKDFVEFIWGGFSVDNATLNRFFSLHYLLPFVLAALAIMHLIAKDEHGSTNPLGITANVDRLYMHPYFTFKDLVTIFLFLLVLGLFLFYAPNKLGHTDNYIPANPMQTPAHIVPEWYFLPFYAILRAIPDKLGGVVAMVGAILILLAMPILDTSRIRGSAFRPLMKISFWFFVVDFAILFWCGGQHVEEPFITLGQVASAFYFGWFLILVPAIGIIENTLMDLASDNSKAK
jgi:ubiquinol-cytochrome c reductase cytochrome b subunit